VPLQTGGGTRLKVLESMALGTPVVSTAKGVEGLAVRDGVHLLIANYPHEYSTAVLRLLLSPGLRQQLVEQAHDLVRERYNWEIFLPRYLELVERVAGNSGSAGSGMGRLGASLKI
jgi:glycosyltransferase involved in cell wall biosynthesis